MLRKSALRGVIGGTALVVGLACLTVCQEAATASPPLPVSQAGPAAIWGPGAEPDAPLPSLTEGQESQAMTKVVAASMGSAIGLTADGKAVEIGSNPFAVLPGFEPVAFPVAALANKTVVDIAADGSYGDAMAVTSDGEVIAWSTGLGAWSDPAFMPDANELGHVKAVAIALGDNAAAAVRQDGTVIAWGDPSRIGGDYGQFTPPGGLTGVDAVYPGNGQTMYALKDDGTLAAWGDNSSGQTDLPPVTTDTDDAVDVTDLATAGGSTVALLSDGSLTAWGSQAGPGGVNEPPAATDSVQIVALAANSSVYFAVDSTGAVYEWGQGAGASSPAFEELPPGVDPANITGLSANDYFTTAIQATFGFIAKPTITGTPTVGQTLTATPATFTATPDEEPTGQWLANGTEIPDATGTTYALTTNEIGKTITYRETATRGAATAKATSDPTAKVAPATVASTTTIAAARSTYGARATVTVTVANGTAGNVTLSGAGAAQTRPVASGRAVFALAPTLRPGTYQVTATYSGTTGVTASTGAGTLVVAKARTGVITVKVAKAKKLTRKTRGKATITVATAPGLAKASGKVTVTLKLGKKTKRVSGTLRNGVVTVKLPKLPKKGKWKVTVTYTGDANYLPAASRTFKVRVR